MHYKNKAETKIGDIVVGETHNSKNRIRIGKVIELMPHQGPCNVKMIVYGFNPTTIDYGDEKRHKLQFIGGEICHALILLDGKQIEIEIATDYADSAKLLRVQDCYRMLNCILDYGNHDSPFFDNKPEF